MLIRVRHELWGLLYRFTLRESYTFKSIGSSWNQQNENVLNLDDADYYIGTMFSSV